MCIFIFSNYTKEKNQLKFDIMRKYIVYLVIYNTLLYIYIFAKN